MHFWRTDSVGRRKCLRLRLRSRELLRQLRGRTLNGQNVLQRPARCYRALSKCSLYGTIVVVGHGSNYSCTELQTTREFSHPGVCSHACVARDISASDRLGAVDTRWFGWARAMRATDGPCPFTRWFLPGREPRAQRRSDTGGVRDDAKALCFATRGEDADCQREFAVFQVQNSLAHTLANYLTTEHLRCIRRFMQRLRRGDGRADQRQS